MTQDRRDWDVIVVGLGALGSAAAYWASTRPGARVLGLERFELGHANGASADHSRIIRLSYHRPDYVRLAKRAYTTWADVQAEAGGDPIVTVTGGLDLWPADPAIPQVDYTDSLAAEGVPFELFDAAEVHAPLAAVAARRRRHRDVAGPGRSRRPVSRATPPIADWPPSAAPSCATRRR